MDEEGNFLGGMEEQPDDMGVDDAAQGDA